MLWVAAPCLAQAQQARSAQARRACLAQATQTRLSFFSKKAFVSLLTKIFPIIRARNAHVSRACTKRLAGSVLALRLEAGYCPPTASTKRAGSSPPLNAKEVFLCCYAIS